MKYLDDFINTISNTMVISDDVQYTYDDGLMRVFSFLSDVKMERRGLFICGNGGSAGIAVHMTADFLKNGGFNVRSLYNPSTITCLGNDLSYDYIFSKQIELMAASGDVLIAISSSGESHNIINAARSIKEAGGEVITFTGFEMTNTLSKMGRYNVYVPAKRYGIVESIHNLVLQQIIDMIVDRDGIALKM